MNSTVNIPIEDPRILGVGMDYKLYVREQLEASWVQAPDDGRQVSSIVVDQQGKIYAVGMDHYIYQRSNLNSPWQLFDNKVALVAIAIEIDGELFGIAADNTLWFLDSSSGVWSWQNPADVPISALTTTMDEQHTTYGIGRDTHFIYKHIPVLGGGKTQARWELVDNTRPCLAITICLDGTILVVGTDHKLYSRASFTPAAPWVQAYDDGVPIMSVAAWLAPLSVAEDFPILGLDMNYNLYLREQLGASWVEVPVDPRRVSSIAVDPQGNIFGLGWDHYIYQRSDLNSPWQLFDNNVALVAMSILPSGKLVGIDANNAVRSRVSSTEWADQIPADVPISAVAVDHQQNTLYGIGRDTHFIYKFIPFFYETPQPHWELVDNMRPCLAISIYLDGTIIVVGTDNQLYSRASFAPTSPWVHIRDNRAPMWFMSVTAWLPPLSPSTNDSRAYTVCLSGTACTRDEGEETRPESDMRIYSDNTGYIPVRIHKEISGTLTATKPSVTVRGVGENDWCQPRNNSEPLRFDGPLKAPDDLLRYVKNYSGGDQRSIASEVTGWAAAALALHAANLAAASGAQQYHFIGHSRGAVECIMAAWFLYAYGPRDIPVNIFAIDPVPGTGEWYGILTQLPPNVTHYVGVYAWDQSVQPADKPYTALVPRPNGRMIGKSEDVTLEGPWWDFWDDSWKILADNAQLADPLVPSNSPQPEGYELYACRGRHSTVAGNTTADGQYDPNNLSASVAPVAELVYKLARAYLTKWGTTFRASCAVSEDALQLRRKIHTDHANFDAMGGGETRTSSLPLRPYVRRVSSISGINPMNTYYLEDVVGDPPYKLTYPVTNERNGAGWVKWKFL